MLANETVPLKPALKVWAYKTLAPGNPVSAPSVEKVLIADVPTGRDNTALLLPVLTAGSLPPETLALLVIPGDAFDNTCTLIAIVLPDPPAAMTVGDVQVITCPPGVHVHPVPPDPAAT